jgi:protein-tyrosine phosphatase/arsenate reductase
MLLVEWRIKSLELKMYEKIKKYADDLIQELDLIPANRKETLEKITKYIVSKISENKEINLMYVCTHNSRRSHFGQIWANVAANYFNLSKVTTFSGGTEATAFNINAINSLKRIGFDIKQMDENQNPIYQVFFDDNFEPSTCFSKVYNHSSNPEKEFAAIMTCGDAEENCPFIPGVELRVATTYNDPKAFDNTVLQDLKYDERCREIARETFYVFYKVNKVVNCP